MDLKTKRAEVSRLVNEAKTLYAQLEEQGDKATADDRQKLANLIADGEVKRDELRRLEKLVELDREVNQPAGQPKAQEQPTVAPQRKSWGRQLVESTQFKNNDGRSVRPVEVKALYESDPARGGALVFSERRTEVVDNARLRDRVLLDILNVSETTSNAIDYIALTGFTNNAAEVVEWDAAAVNFGLKPESDMTFEERSASVKTIAHWIRESRNILQDAPRLQNLVDTKLVAGLEIRLESQCLNGNGTGPNLRGILATPGIQTRTMHATTPVGRGQTTTDTRADTLRRALTDIALAFYKPDAIVPNPTDAENIELHKDSTGNYTKIYDPVAMRIWRVPVVETSAIAAGTALAGAFGTGATLYVREDATVRVSENVNDDFIRNAIRVLAELRAAMAVTDPLAFERATLI